MHFFAYSYSQTFEVLWDNARAERSLIVQYPMLYTFRHSIELWLKNRDLAKGSCMQISSNSHASLPTSLDVGVDRFEPHWIRDETESGVSVSPLEGSGDERRERRHRWAK